FSKDMELIDQILPLNIESLINSCSSAVLAFIVISIQGFKFFATCIVITATYIIIGTLYISTSRELKRLETANRSSIYAAFDNIIEGRSIIRAFGVRKKFNKNLWDLIDRYNRPILMNWACNQWLHVYSNFVGVKRIKEYLKLKEEDLNTDDSSVKWPINDSGYIVEFGNPYELLQNP
ncbi:12869_t:CDS:2, partial [Gigaspora rosea]